jgi:hypothetical protein
MTPPDDDPILLDRVCLVTLVGVAVLVIVYRFW